MSSEVDQLVEGLTVALHTGDLEAVEAFLRLIAVRDPGTASNIYGAMRFAVDVNADADLDAERDSGA